jgi:hypothetical protein
MSFEKSMNGVIITYELPALNNVLSPIVASVCNGLRQGSVHY